MKVIKIVRMILHAAALVLTAIAVVFVAISICTPYWLLAQSDHETHQFGLWQQCSEQDMTSKKICEWKQAQPDTPFDRSKFDVGQMKQKYMSSWDTQTLILLSVSTVFGILALVFGAVGFFVDFCKYRTIIKCMCFIWIICTVIACILGLSGLLVYLRHSYEKENRAIRLNTTDLDKTELTYGPSFHNCLTGIVLYAVAFLICVVSTIMVCVLSNKQKYDYVEVPRRSHGGHTVGSAV